MPVVRSCIPMGLVSLGVEVSKKDDGRVVRRVRRERIRVSNCSIEVASLFLENKKLDDATADEEHGPTVGHQYQARRL